MLAASHSNARAQSPTGVLLTEPLSYTAVNPAAKGTSYSLRAVRGRSVTVGFPDAWLDPLQGGLTGREAQAVVDLADVAYATMSDLTGARPAAPSGLSHAFVIVFVETGGIGGYTPLGSGRVEVSTRQLASVRDAVKRGVLADIIVHEMLHAFDAYHAYLLDYYADSPHAWTELLIPLVNYRMRGEGFYSQAEGGLADAARLYTAGWDAKTPADAPLWSQCVLPGQGCEADGIKANRAWAGMLLRFVRVFGVEAFRKALAKVGEASRAGTQPGATAADRNDFLVEALAAGAEADVTCAMDAWRWEVSPAARARVKAKYPAAARQCADGDGDGYSPVRGDVDDADASRSPATGEQPDGRDDDGDGYADDRGYDADGEANPAPRGAGLPARLRGTLRPGSSVARFTFATDSPRVILLRAMSTTTGWGYIVRVRPAGSTPLDNAEEMFTSVDWVTRSYVPLPRAYTWLVEVQGMFGAGQSQGAFDVVIAQAAAGGEVTSDSVTLEAAPAPGAEGSFTVGARVSPPPPAGAQVAFWSSRGGLVKVADVATDGTVAPWAWQSDAAGWGASAITGLRAQLLAGGAPAARVSSASWVGKGTNSESVVSQPTADVSVKQRGGSFTRAATTSDVINLEFEIRDEGADDAPVTVTVQLDQLFAINSAAAAGGSVTLDRAAHAVTFRAQRLRSGGRAALWVAASAPGAGGRVLTATATAATSGERVDLVPANDAASISVEVSGPSRCPVITAFTSSASTVAAGTPVVISWAVSNADAALLNGTTVTGLNGTAQFTLSSNTTFTLTATRDGCASAARDLAVSVNTPQPVDYDIRALPLRADDDPAARRLTPGGLVRLSITLPGYSLQAQALGRDSGGTWVEPAAGLGVAVNGTWAKLVSVAPAEATSRYALYLDFVIPTGTAVGSQLVVTVTDAEGARVLADRRVSDAGATIVESEPALWASGGRALAMNAWSFVAFTDGSPAKAGDRVLLFASGLGAGVTTTAVVGLRDDGSSTPLTVEGINELPSLPGVFQIRVQLPDAVHGPGLLEVQVRTGKGSDSRRAALPVE